MKAAASSSSGVLEVPSGDAVALVYGDERLSWNELGGQVDSLAGALASRGFGVLWYGPEDGARFMAKSDADLGAVMKSVGIAK